VSYSNQSGNTSVFICTNGFDNSILIEEIIEIERDLFLKYLMYLFLSLVQKEATQGELRVEMPGLMGPGHLLATTTNLPL